MNLINHIDDIAEVITSHAVGMKKVLIANSDTETNITQIAITQLKAGEIAKAHIHKDMEEWFIILEGNIIFSIDNDEYQCYKNDFVTIPIGYSHELHAITDCKVITIGCKY